MGVEKCSWMAHSKRDQKLCMHDVSHVVARNCAVDLCYPDMLVNPGCVILHLHALLLHALHCGDGV